MSHAQDARLSIGLGFSSRPNFSFSQESIAGSLTPLPEALIRGSLVCDNLVLSNSKRVLIQRHLAFLGLTNSVRTRLLKHVMCVP